MNSGHTPARKWHDTTVKNARQAFIENVTTDPENPSGNGWSFLLHAGSEDGFVPNACLLFTAKRGDGDYHDEMDANRFKTWFIEQLLPNIPQKSVIVMDNASYHSVRLNKIPNSNSKKEEMLAFLADHRIRHDSKMTKKQLYPLIQGVRDTCVIMYEIDELAKAAGHTILRLPPYHCDLNPIELVWSQVKRYVASNNQSFTLAEVEALTKSGIENVAPGNWFNYCRKIVRDEEKYRQLDGLDVAPIVNPIVINLNDSDSDSDSDEDEDATDLFDPFYTL